MSRKPNRTTKAQARLDRLIGRLISKKCGAEDGELKDEAQALERTLEAVMLASQNASASVLNHLADYFGAPNGSINFERELTNRRHLLSPHPSAVPPGLHRYITARNNRVAKSQNWNAVNRTPEQLVQELVRLAKNGRAQGKGANHVFSAMRAARKKEIRALKVAIESCLTEGLLSDPNFVPWQLGHVLLLRDFAIQDLETTPEQCEALNRKIKLLKNLQRETEHAP